MSDKIRTIASRNHQQFDQIWNELRPEIHRMNKRSQFEPDHLEFLVQQICWQLFKKMRPGKN